MEHYELIIRFFEEIGAVREAEMYVKLFKKGEPHRFAVIELAHDLSQISLHVLALQLSYIASLDLYPILVHGQCSARRPSRGTGKFLEWLNGERKQMPECGEEERRTAFESTMAMNETLVSSLMLNETEAAGIFSDAFSVDSAGRIDARTTAIARAIRRDEIPVVAALAAAEGAKKPTPIRLFDATAALVRKLKPRKIIKIREYGALRKLDGSNIDYVNLTLHSSELLKKDVMNRGDVKILARAQEILSHLPKKSMLEICSSANLLRELFTQKGAGTLIKAGRALKVFDSLEGLSRSRLRALIEKSFGRKLVRSYFTPAAAKKAPFATVIADPDYKGVCIVRRIEGLDYLDKFAVRPEARGEGIAADLWTMLEERHSAFFWRSRPTNPINGWYFERSTGCYKTDSWTVFWKNLDESDAVKAIDLAHRIKPTLTS